jgi:molecular chaperone DnaJ
MQMVLVADVGISFLPSTPCRSSLRQQPNPVFHSQNVFRDSNRVPNRKISILMAADFYGDLGVSSSAGDKEIKSAFRKKAKVCHPDIAPEKDEEWQRVNRAYEVLSDPEQRKRYDQFGEAGVQGASGAPQGGEGFGEQVDLSDIFESFFGGGMGSPFGSSSGGRSSQRGPQRGDDLRFDLEVDFAVACFGGEEKVKIRHLEKCDTCSGDGVKPGSKKRKCSTCDGQGAVMQVTRTPLGNFQTQSACPTCRGGGQIIDEYCPKCSGKGTVQVPKTVSLNVPAGVEEGQKLRVRGEGDAGPNGGPSGDLYIFIKVKPDKRFRREGTEIFTDVEVGYIDAILGTEAPVTTLDGEIKIKIPPGSQPETVLRLKGKGAPKLGEKTSRGNHFVTLKVKIPAKLTSREREIVEELRAIQENK